MGQVINMNIYLQRMKVVKMCKILEKIKNKTASELLKEYKMDTTPPINISDLIEKLGIYTIATEFDEIEEAQKIEYGSILGATFSNGEDLNIFYKKSDSFHRKKFTIAHELGHCCYDCPNNESSHIEYRLHPFSNLTKIDLEKERKANIFAGELLIPYNSLKEQYSKMIIPSLSELSKIFDVSTSVMAARLDYLKLSYYKDSITEIIL